MLCDMQSRPDGGAPLAVKADAANTMLHYQAMLHTEMALLF